MYNVPRISGRMPKWVLPSQVLVVRNGRRARARLVAVGSHVPSRVLTNADLEQMVETSDEWIVSRTGIRERRISAEDEAASDLAAMAAAQILERGGVAPEELDMMMVLTATADFLFPSTSSAVCGLIGATNAAPLGQNLVYLAAWSVGLAILAVRAYRLEESRRLA